MHFSAQEEYGLRCVLQLAMSYNSEALTAKEISEREQISLEYAHKLLGILKRKGFIKSIRGVKGGFRLKKAPGEITVHEVLALLASEINADGHCAKFNRKGQDCPHRGVCVAKPFWDNVIRYSKTLGSKVTLQDLFDRNVPQPG